MQPNALIITMVEALVKCTTLCLILLGMLPEGIGLRYLIKFCMHGFMKDQAS